MDKDSSQIFQTNSSSRWQGFKWAGRLLLFLFVIAIVIVAIAMNNLFDQNIPLSDKALKKVLTDTNMAAYRQSELGKKYRGVRRYFDTLSEKKKAKGFRDTVLDFSNSHYFSDSLGIRAAIYEGWQPQAYTSLKKNISKINLFVPDWLYINGKTDTLYAGIDQDAFALVKKAGISVLPTLSNYSKDAKGGDILDSVIHVKSKRERLIVDIFKACVKYKFIGVNLSFDGLHDKDKTAYIDFQKELYARFHQQNLIVTSNLLLYNYGLYDYKELADCTDYFFLSAYNEHSDDGEPGPVSSQHWIEDAVAKVTKTIPDEKIVLGMAAFGYDWCNKGKDSVKRVSWQNATLLAKKSGATINFDNDTYNLHFQYLDDTSAIHDVHFTDAATTFNILRFVTEYGLAGVSLDQFGGEDDRIWSYYNKPLTKTFLQKFDFSVFKHSEQNSVQFVGFGEILDFASSPDKGLIHVELDNDNMLISEETYEEIPTAYYVTKLGRGTNKKLVLTFDDGPDKVYTAQILDTLAYYNVPASFFVVGIEAENNIPLVKRIYKEGYEIGNHTFFHPDMSKVSDERASFEMDATRLIIECITGHSTILFRAPFNADFEPNTYEEIKPVELSRKKNYITVGESIDPEDWLQSVDPTMNADTIFNRVVKGFNDIIERSFQSSDTGSIILLHDAGGNREATVKATGMIIRYFKERGYKFTTIADLLGKSKDELMPPVPKGSGYYLLQFNAFVFEAYYVLSTFFFSMFIVFLILSAIRLLIIAVVAILQKRKEKKNVYPSFNKQNAQLVSIIVPAYNEEVNAVSSLHNLLRCDYPNFEIIFIDDGSKDATYENVKAAFETCDKVSVFTKQNGGKASALNYGINQSHADFVVCIDADTKLLPDAVSKLMRQFNNEKVGAVAGVVKVGNEVNAITKWQSIEYITSQNFDRKAFAYLNAITVVPGAIGAFRKDALLIAGGFTTDTLAEDCDITLRILKAGYIVTNEPEAISYTEVPETLKQFMKQRYRWTYGVLQTFWKHKNTLFNTNYKSLGWIAMPDLLLFKYIIPLFTPLADIIMILGLFSENRDKILGYYLIFLAVDSFIALIAFAFEKEKPWKLAWLFVQRLIYRWLMLVILFRSLRKAIKGELQHWGVLKRTGNVKDISLEA
jgi:cellulose synthase/poly-beta-1,6-N-acetylglucosamine synthase-like glycosyltransferase/spore germination protein YaaH/peptidoglycan/xylan/chitin deacetylase (PgdA/CDA1 family)